jgi:NAD(P)-dependent dehydrogenase (short-subunit alcohol dehydrogenase family)
MEMEGKVVVLTGANTGIGKQTTLELAKRGARVVMACRDAARGEAARAEILATTDGRGELEVRELDLSSLDSVRAFADKANADLARIDVLVNNAGIFPQKAWKTVDGFEAQFGVNYLGPFLLTNLLLDKLKASAPSRIVNVTSMMHTKGTIDFDSFRGEKPYKASIAYNQSKLANLVFSNELARRLEGTGVTSNAVHPGAIATDITRELPWIARKLVGFIFKGVAVGAQGPMLVATDPALADATGRYWKETTETAPSAEALDPAVGSRLWEQSARFCGFPMKQPA